MAPQRQQSNPERPAPRLYLVTPRLADPAGFREPLAAALPAGDVAAVLIVLADADERSLINRLKLLVPLVQSHGAAAVVDGRPEIVARGGADGAHLSGVAALRDAIADLKPDRIAGVGDLGSRHDAMGAAELGADYVMFGEPDADGQRPRFEAVEERIGWWAEVFEPPCVGFAANHDEVAALVAAGADFVAVGDLVWADPRGPAAAMSDLGLRLTAAVAVVEPAP